VKYAMASVLIPDEYREAFYKNTKNTMQDAASALQWNIYRGLCENLNEDMPLFNLLPCDSFPQYYKYPFVKGFSFDKKGQNLGFCNIKLIRGYFRTVALKKALREWCRAEKEEKTLFLYTVSQPLMAAVSEVKKEYPDLRVCAIVADLPDMASLSSKKSALLKMVSAGRAKSAYSLLSAVDAFVLLTKHMAEYMKLTQPYCVMEGIAPDGVEWGEETPRGDEKIVLYTGTLHRKFGILHLLESFQKTTTPALRLVVCGVGDSEEELKNAALTDRRIDFRGRVSRQEALELQRKAAVLVNPRLNNEEFTRYSFPSKTMEYLSSGVPVIAYKLDGIPQEYDQYLNYPASDSVEDLAEAMEKICALDNDARAKLGQRGRDFVLSQKNRKVQTARILEFLQKI